MTPVRVAALDLTDRPRPAFALASIEILAFLSTALALTLASVLPPSYIMSPSLEDCPNEVIEGIVVLLDLNDICGLRQCNRTLATKTTQNHFKSYFRSKHVDITDSALRTFVDITQPGWLGCLIQHLVLVGVVNNTKALEYILEEESYLEEEGKGNREKQIKAQQDLEILEQRQTDYEQLHGSGTDVSLLSEAFSNIVANSKTGKLLSLSIEVAVYREDAEKRLPPLAGGSWRFIWQSAADTFHIALRSLAASNLLIEKLSIFNDRQLQRCSLACDELGSIDFEHKGLAISLASLKSLSVSISDRVIFHSKKDAERSDDPADEIDWDESDEERDIDDVKAEAADRGNFIGLAKLLQLSSQLEDLEIHQYGLSTGVLTQADLHRERLLQRVAEIDTPPNLKRIELRGLHVREEDLLAFIRRTGVRKLSMHNVRMSLGTFRSVFNYCTSDAAGMEELYFDELFEQHLRLYFDGPGHFRFPPLTGPGGSDTLERAGAEVKQQISYRSAQEVGIGSPATMEYKLQRWREYGPPFRGVA